MIISGMLILGMQIPGMLIIIQTYTDNKELMELLKPAAGDFPGFLLIKNF